MDTYERVQEYLNRLGLSVTEEILDNYLESVKRQIVHGDARSPPRTGGEEPEIQEG